MGTLDSKGLMIILDIYHKEKYLHQKDKKENYRKNLFFFMKYKWNHYTNNDIHHHEKAWKIVRTSMEFSKIGAGYDAL